jgi:hypothetical protein
MSEEDDEALAGLAASEAQALAEVRGVRLRLIPDGGACQDFCVRA